MIASRQWLAIRLVYCLDVIGVGVGIGIGIDPCRVLRRFLVSESHHAYFHSFDTDSDTDPDADFLSLIPFRE